MYASAKNLLRLSLLAALVAATSTSIACMDEGHGGGAGAPAAPSMLTGSLLSGGAHLIWQDNSDNETQFMVMRKEMGAADYTVASSPPFDTTQYHDAPLTSGTTYVYAVMAMNDSGESELSNEVMVSIP